MYKSQRWTAEQLKQMNEARFMEELLDTLKFSPKTSTADYEHLHSRMAEIEEMIKLRMAHKPADKD